jgi:hypothetical protein
MFPPVASSRMNNLPLEQLDVWNRKIKYYEYPIDEKNILTFGFTNAGSGYGRRRISDNTRI